MKAKNSFVTVFCVAMATIAVLFLSFSPAYATSEASKSLSPVHNGHAAQHTATDLKFRVQMIEGEQDNYYMLSYSVSTTPAIGGTQTITEKKTAQGNIWAIDVKYDNISVTYCTNITINAKATLNEWNALEIKKVKWSYGVGGDKKASPDHGFAYPYPGEIEYLAGNIHNTSYTFYNTDSLYELTLNYLQFYLDTTWYEPEDQWGPIGTLIEEVTGPFVLHPDDSLYVSLDSIPDRLNSYIYVAGEMEYQMPDFDYEVMQFRDGHEEEVPPYMDIPTLGEWGLIIFGVVLIGFITYVFLRRRKAVAVSVVEP